MLFFERALSYSMCLIIFSLLSECPSGWVDGGHLGCYYAANEVPRMSYASAKAYCKSFDRRAHLVEIKTRQIQTFVAGLRALQSHSWPYWWLGASKQATV